MSAPLPAHRGRCLCGAVSFEVAAALASPVACHCSMCRRQSGHFWASADVPRDALTLRGAELVTWYRSSEKVRRGFCSRCGSALFWDAMAKPVLSIAMGAFDAPTGARLARHIFTADQGDYYDIADGVPRE